MPVDDSLTIPEPLLKDGDGLLIVGICERQASNGLKCSPSEERPQIVKLVCPGKLMIFMDGRLK